MLNERYSLKDFTLHHDFKTYLRMEAKEREHKAKMELMKLRISKVRKYKRLKWLKEKINFIKKILKEV